MLTADLVPARRRAGKLLLAKWTRARGERAGELAAEVLEIIGASLGETRETVEQDLAAIEINPAELKLVRGLARLALQRCRFEAEDGDDPVALRAQLFAASTAARLAGTWQRDVLVAGVATARGLVPEQLDRLLFADLRGTHLLAATHVETPVELVERYVLNLHQAVLLRAVAIEATLTTRDGALLRDIFRRLKFHRLLWRSERIDDATVRLKIDGPLALFSQSTRYGLELAVVLPALVQCDRWSIVADVRWGRDAVTSSFELAGRRGAFGGPAGPVSLPDELQQFCDALERSALGWRAEPAATVHDVPGVGVFVPDLRLISKHGDVVLLEALGFWSREAVFRRADLVAAGLGAPVVFVASERLRVDPKVIAGTQPAALVLYKGVLSARAVVSAAEAVLARSVPATGAM